MDYWKLKQQKNTAFLIKLMEAVRIKKKYDYKDKYKIAVQDKNET